MEEPWEYSALYAVSTRADPPSARGNTHAAISYQKRSFFCSRSKKTLKFSANRRKRRMALSPSSVTRAPPPPLPPAVISTNGIFDCRFMESTRSQAWRYAISRDLAALVIEPCSRICSRRLTRPQPMNVPSGPSIQIRPRTPRMGSMQRLWLLFLFGICAIYHRE